MLHTLWPILMEMALEQSILGVMVKKVLSEEMLRGLLIHRVMEKKKMRMHVLSDMLMEP